MRCPRIVSGGFFRLHHVAIGGLSSHDDSNANGPFRGMPGHLWSRVLWVTLARTSCSASRDARGWTVLSPASASPPAAGLSSQHLWSFIGDHGVETKVGDGITANLDPSRNRESRLCGYRRGGGSLRADPSRNPRTNIAEYECQCAVPLAELRCTVSTFVPFVLNWTRNTR